MTHADNTTGSTRVMEILREVKKLAQEYRNATGKPLGITGEVAEYEAARILGLKLTPARRPNGDRPGVPVGAVDECVDEPPKGFR